MRGYKPGEAGFLLGSGTGLGWGRGVKMDLSLIYDGFTFIALSRNIEGIDILLVQLQHFKRELHEHK